MDWGSNVVEKGSVAQVASTPVRSGSPQTIDIRPDGIHDFDTLQLPLYRLFLDKIFDFYCSGDLLDKKSTSRLVPINAHLPDTYEPC